MISNKYALITVLFLLGVSPSLFAQRDTVYFDESWTKLPNKFKAHYYGVREKEDNGTYKVEDYHMNGILQMAGHYVDLDSSVETGYFTYYNEYGVKSSEGLYNDGKKEGVWKNYRAGEQEILWYVEHYRRDTLDGVYRSFYKNGELKRDELWKNGTRISGKRFSEEGVEMIYTPFIIMPVAPYDVNKYLSKNIEYPEDCRKKKIEGRVRLRFIINKDGVVTNVTIKDGVHPSIDKEAIRVVTSMPNWRPGMEDDELRSVYFTLPINFKLN